jgi:hypothetical protein
MRERTAGLGLSFGEIIEAFARDDVHPRLPLATG